MRQVHAVLLPQKGTKRHENLVFTRLRYPEAKAEFLSPNLEDEERPGIRNSRLTCGLLSPEF